MDPLSLIGLGAGFFGKLFGANPEEEYQKRKAAAAEALRTAKTKALDRITRLITGNTSSNIAQVTQSGAERAASIGRPEAADAFIQPQVSKVATAGSESLQRGIGEVESDYDRQLAALEMQGLDRPVQPNAGDFVAELGKGVGNYAGQQAYLNAIRPVSKPSSVPAPTEQTGLTPLPTGLGTPTPESTGMTPAYQEPSQFQGLPMAMRKKRMNLQGAYTVPDYTMAARR